jgi:hypothetical protein
MIEVHTIISSVPAANIGKKPATAYHATHSFLDPYSVQFPVLHKLAIEAGLYIDIQCF